MKRVIILFFFFMFNIHFSQEMIIDNGIIIRDTVTIYQITEIEEDKDEYVIHAVKDEYHFRIKSGKESNCNCTNYNQLQVGKYFQLDIRNYNNSDTRTLYSTKYKGMGFCEPLGNAEFLCEYDPKVLNTYSQVLNLRGLCLVND